MDPQSFFQLVNPAIFIGIGVLFFLIARIRPERWETKFLAASYVLGSIGMVTDFMRFTLSEPVASITSNAFYLSATIIFSIGFVARAQVKIPIRTILATAVLTAFGIFYFRFFSSSLPTRTLIATIGNGFVYAVALVYAWPSLKGRLNTGIKWLFGLYTAQFFVRAILFTWLGGLPETNNDYSQSAYQLIFHLSAGVTALGLASLMLTDYILILLRDFRKDALTDQLSGLLNRRGFDDAMGKLLAKGHAKTDILVAIAADIDHFKTLNDTYGHAFGDKIIKEIGRLLNTHNADRAVAARLGGEEFAFIIVTQDTRAALQTAEALRKKFAALKFSHETGDVSLTASFGVARYRPGEPVSELMARADTALYKAKDTGRNKVVAQSEAKLTAIASEESPVQRLKA